ncbi:MULTISPECIES: 16S rRNA (guanine(966)-N(2))-methyltransferase RsmD [unclassified Paenibacillus]|uniref:16S rRNA (guanine(966)-N(2))-methyltransferase RsmD n=1 Tax=unclassified Paenibacillus TaxID=185978 RepID=UPI001AE88896|nr:MULTISPECIES: 16S rRNA (guanine(966)-N(2))-methyltransferase RsmD [unclassified Paenibacillus]MBP1156059.1 16S rRNA (guanine(966)-N(2))-methyltransferase RsmD [Paenibacillus sp. PvP091]MBP1168555.1 16S rRNA (guanine(966)-N(2))-methyltransferase RsmD [Paenibacillus sp. PvR098]MBP2439583.1 16S rRNA (guanine(966)-N(2))-methyltransferase RsmD [Paenibacillus sp. PvP052]
MRVISGSAKGRPLKAVPGTGTRPTTDKVKEAVFSMIGPYFDGGQVLDLFAGTGGLSIEALSRGMDQAVLTDMDKKAIDTIRHNLQATGLSDRAEVYRNDALRAIKALSKREAQFDLVFMDPPYKLKIIGELLEQLQQDGLLAEGARVVVEHDAEDRHEESYGSLEQVRRAEYGDTAITIYQSRAGV